MDMNHEFSTTRNLGPKNGKSGMGDFDEYFSVSIARDGRQVDTCLKIRYQVYCQERGWHTEVVSDRGREFDRYDARSDQILLVYKPLGVAIGTTRLVKPTGSRDGDDLPLEDIKPSPMLHFPENVDRREVGEISRFSIINLMARRGMDCPYPDMGWTYDPAAIRKQLRRALPRLSLGLVRGSIMAARENNIQYICGAMEPAFIRLLANFGIHFHCLGPMRSYHGKRQPAYVKVDEIKRTMACERPELYELVFQETPSVLDHPLETADGRIVSSSAV